MKTFYKSSCKLLLCFFLVCVFTTQKTNAQTIMLSTTNTALHTCASNVSTVDSFTVSGNNLISDIIISAPTNSEISTTLTGIYGTSIILPLLVDSVANTNIYVRIANTATTSGLDSIICTATNAVTQFFLVNATVSNPSASTTITSACDSLWWNGTKYTSTGIYTDTIPNAAGCDSIMTLDLTINYSINVTIPMFACDSFIWKGKTYYSTGLYSDTATQSNGCLNISNLQLTINNSSTSTSTQTACDSLWWNGTKYTSTGIYTDTIPNAAGCDSIMTLDLTINYSINVTTPMFACDSFIWKGKTYYSTGLYSDTATQSNGCLNISNLQLTINNISTSTSTQTACDSLWWNGTKYTASGTYYDTIPNAAGCDSIMTLNLTINNSSTSTSTQTSCDSLWWNGTKYTSTGIYTDTILNATGCDSIMTLNLTINNSSSSIFTTSACGSYTWALNSKVYTASNNIDTVHLTTVNGCDSLVTLNLTILANITGVKVYNVGAYCGTTASATLTTNINSTFGTVSYEWTAAPFTGTGWQYAGSDSTLVVAVSEPTQYVLRVTIAGCGTFYSNQEMVMPVKAPTVSLAPNPTTSICNNSNISFIAASADSGINKYAFYQGSTQVQTGAGLTYTTPNLTTANDGVMYKLEATNTKPVFDGNIDENFWGVPLAASVWGPSSSFGAGHELNAVYARADNDNIYLAIGGNVQNSNRIMLFVDSKTGGYNTGNYGRGGLGNNSIKNFNSGNVFDPGFNPDYCIGIGTDGTRSQFYFDIVEMKGNAATGTSVNNYIGSNLNPASGYSIGANPANSSQTQGFEVAIPKSALGYTSGDIRIFAMYSADNGFLNNQFLTRATIGSGNYGNGVVNFGLAAPGPITVPIESLTNLTCITTVTTTVTVKANATSNKYDTVCNNMLPYTWAGKNYTMSGMYYDTTLGSNGCDSFAILHLLVKDTTTSSTSITECNNQLPYNWNGVDYNTSGTYTFKTTNAAGCDSVATLIFTISDTTTSSTSITKCNNQLPYNWNGTNYNTNGTYTFKTTNAAGCDSIATLVFTVTDTTTSSTSITKCSNQLPYNWNGVNYNTSGTYNWKGMNAAGCDSIATLEFTVKDTSVSTLTITRCSNQLPYNWNGTNYSATGTYSITGLTNAAGCDSIATLIFTVRDTTTSITTTSTCDSLWWNGVKYTASGTYTFSTPNSVGCDSTAILNLTVNHSSISSTTLAVCDSITWNNVKYTTSGVYSFSTLNSVGCDSTATLNLTVNNSSISSNILAVCDSITWNNVKYTTSGVYSFSTLNSVGCDSTATLNLTVNHSTFTNITQAACDSFVWKGTTYTTSGQYYFASTNASGCTSNDTLNLTITATPAIPTITISSTNVIVPASGVAYACNSIVGATTYTWSYTGTGVTIATGQGTTNMTADFDSIATNGNIQVIASNGTCNSAAATASIILPTTITNFIVSKLNKNILLKWTTSLEVNSKNFEVQKSIESKDFETIGTITAKGFSSEYQFTDNKLSTTVYSLPSTIYYRLKQIDKDGKFEYSQTRQIVLNDKQEKSNIVIYPNPSTSFITIVTSNAKGIKIFNNIGKMIYESIENRVSYFVPLSSFAAGIYYVEVTTKDGKKEVEKFVKK